MSQIIMGIWRHSKSYDIALRVQNLRLSSGLLFQARDQPPETIELEPICDVISPNAIVFTCEGSNKCDTLPEVSLGVDIVWRVCSDDVESLGRFE